MRKRVAKRILSKSTWYYPWHRWDTIRKAQQIQRRAEKQWYKHLPEWRKVEMSAGTFQPNEPGFYTLSMASFGSWTVSKVDHTSGTITVTCTP